MCNNQDCIDIRHKDARLWQRYQREKAKTPMLFPTEGAKLLGVSELALLLASPHSQYLGTQCQDILTKLEQFHELLSIVRNEHAVHEKIGRYQNLKISTNTALMVNVGGLDLRYFINQWQHMLAISIHGNDNDNDNDNSNHNKPTHSLQFFDEQGNAINKIFLQSTSDDQVQKWQALIDEYAKQANTYVDIVNNVDSVNNNTDDMNTDEINDDINKDTPQEICLKKSQQHDGDWRLQALDEKTIADFQQQWLNMNNIHQFHFIIQKLGIDRASSYHHAPEKHAVALQVDAIEPLFQLVKEHDCPLMTFVGNTGVVQIQTGNIHHIKRTGDWINILDKDSTQFTLHLHDVAIAQLWVVKRPTSDGIITCVEAFDKSGKTIVSFFGQRLEGEPELASWRHVTDKLIQDFAKPIAQTAQSAHPA